MERSPQPNTAQKSEAVQPIPPPTTVVPTAPSGILGPTTKSALPNDVGLPIPVPNKAEPAQPLRPPVKESDTLAQKPAILTGGKSVPTSSASTVSPPTASSPTHVSRGLLLVTSNVAGGRITLDGRSDATWVTPHTFADVPIGSHSVVVSREGYKDYQQAVRIDSGSTALVAANLSMRSSETNIATTPPGAEVLIDGKSHGPSPVRTKIDAGQQAYPNPPAGSTLRTPTNATGRRENGKWEVSEEISPMDGSRSLALTLKAEQSIPSLVGLGDFPVLTISCKSHHTAAYIHTGSLPFDPDKGGKYRVQLRVDDGQLITQYWGASNSYDALYAPKPVELAKQLAASKKLAFEFTPLASGPVATWFAVEGLERPLGKVADTCGWTP